MKNEMNDLINATNTLLEAVWVSRMALEGWIRYPNGTRTEVALVSTHLAEAFLSARTAVEEARSVLQAASREGSTTAIH